MERGLPLAERFPGSARGYRIETCCALKGVIAEAEAAFFAVLDRYTIDDLVRGNRELRGFVLGGPADELSSDVRSQARAIAKTGRGAGTRRDRRASPDSRSARRRMQAQPAVQHRRGAAGRYPVRYPATPSATLLPRGVSIVTPTVRIPFAEARPVSATSRASPVVPAMTPTRTALSRSS